MARIIYPINGKTYTAEDVEILNSPRTSGIYSVLDFDCSLSGNVLTIGKGLAWIKNGDFTGKCVAFTEPETLTLDSADSTKNRFDVVAIRYDASKTEPELVIIKGAAGDIPMLPERKKETYLYELFLYSILRKAGEGSASFENLSDLRDNETFCGIMRDSVTSSVAPLYETLYDDETGMSLFDGQPIPVETDKYVSYVATVKGSDMVVEIPLYVFGGISFGEKINGKRVISTSAGDETTFLITFECFPENISISDIFWSSDTGSGQAILTKLVGITKQPEGYVKVDDIYNPESHNAQSGEAVKQAIEKALENFEGGGVDNSPIIDILNNQINGTVDLGEVAWEIGAIASANGVNSTAKNRIRSTEIEFDGNLSIKVFGDKKIYIHFFKDGTFITGKSVGWVKEVNLANYVNLEATHIRLVGAYDNDTNITSVDDIVSQILYINKENSIIGDVENLKEKTVDLSSTFNLVKNQINGIVDVGNVVWEAGGIYSNSGADATSNDPSKKNRVRSSKISYQDNINVSATGDRKFSVFFYNNDTYITGKNVMWVKDINLADYVEIGATHFRLVSAYDDDKDITDITDVYSCIVLYNHDSLVCDIETLKDDTILKDATKLVNAGFIVGSIESSTGADNNSNKTRIRSSYIEYSENLEVFCYGGYKFGIYLYDENKTMLHSVYWLTGKVDMSVYAGIGATSFRILVAYNDDRIVVDLDEISQNIVVYTPSGLTRKIFDTSVYEFDFENSDLPVLYLEGDTSEMTKDNAVTLTYKFKNPLTKYVGDAMASRRPIVPNIADGLSGTCTCKWQGSSSVRLNYPKRNYTIKLDNDLNVVNPWVNSAEEVISKNWGSHKKFCMKANWVDPSNLRNVVNARLWSQVVAMRENVDPIMQSAPNYGAIDGFPIVIVINGEFEGLYTFNIPKDDWMFGMGNGTNEYLLAGENNALKSCGFAELAVVDENDFSLEYKPDDVELSTVVNSFNTVIQATIDAGADWETTLAPYMDIESVIDYFIFVNCIGGHDNLRKNILYGTYDGTKWFMSAYDLDTTYGSNPYGRSWYPVKNSRNQFKECTIMHRLAKLMYDHSKERLKTRYQELRSSVLSDENIWYMLNSFANAIPKGVYDMDAKKWETMPATSTANINNYMNFYRMHCVYLDKEIEAL